MGEVHSGIPAGDSAVFGGEDEDGGFAGGFPFVQEEVGGAAVVDDPGRSGWRAGSSESRGRDNDEVAGAAVGFDEDVDGVSVAVVQSRRTGIVIGDPPWTASCAAGLDGGGAGESPAIFQVGVSVGGHAW